MEFKSPVYCNHASGPCNDICEYDEDCVHKESVHQQSALTNVSFSSNKVENLADQSLIDPNSDTIELNKILSNCDDPRYDRLAATALSCAISVREKNEPTTIQWLAENYEELISRYGSLKNLTKSSTMAYKSRIRRGIRNCCGAVCPDVLSSRPYIVAPKRKHVQSKNIVSAKAINTTNLDFDGQLAEAIDAIRKWPDLKDALMCTLGTLISARYTGNEKNSPIDVE